MNKINVNFMKNLLKICAAIPTNFRNEIQVETKFDKFVQLFIEIQAEGSFWKKLTKF